MERNPDGTFGKGNPGRPKGSRNKLSKAVLKAWAADVEEHGADVIRRLREDDPATYARVAASFVPKNIELELDGDMDMNLNVTFPDVSSTE